MTAPSSVVKETAKTALKNKYFKSIVCGCFLIFEELICVMISNLVSIITESIAAVFFVRTVLIVFLGIPLFLGVLRFFRRLIWGQDDDVILAFRYFSSVKEYRRAVTFSLYLVGKILINGILLFLPAIIVDLFSSSYFYTFFDMSMPVWASNLWIISAVLKVIASVWLLFVSLKYYLSPFLMVSDDGMDASEAVHMSEVVTRPTVFDFFFLVVSFSGWIILSVFMIPLVFTMPYFITSYAVHCRFTVTEYNRLVDSSLGSVPSFSVKL